MPAAPGPPGCAGSAGSGAPHPGFPDDDAGTGIPSGRILPTAVSGARRRIRGVLPGIRMASSYPPAVRRGSSIRLPFAA